MLKVAWAEADDQRMPTDSFPGGVWTMSKYDKPQIKFDYKVFIMRGDSLLSCGRDGVTGI